MRTFKSVIVCQFKGPRGPRGPRGVQGRDVGYGLLRKATITAGHAKLI